MKPWVIKSTERVRDFFFRPASPRPLAALRILLSLILILQGFLVAPDLFELYGRQGFLQGAVLDYMMAPFHGALPSLMWLPTDLMHHALSPDAWLAFAFYAYMLALVFLLLGFYTRVAATITVLSHWLLLGAGFWSSYGADRFAQIALFYFIWMPVSGIWSFDHGWNGLAAKGTRLAIDPWPTARVSLRIFQLHLCIVYFSTAIAKAHGQQWWDGEAIWFALLSYGTPAAQAITLKLASDGWLFRLLSWGTLFIEFAYAFLVWPRLTRGLTVLLICALHFGIALSLGLFSFSLIMICFSFTLFGLSAEVGPRPEPTEFAAV